MTASKKSKFEEVSKFRCWNCGQVQYKTSSDTKCINCLEPVTKGESKKVTKTETKKTIKYRVVKTYRKGRTRKYIKDVPTDPEEMFQAESDLQIVSFFIPERDGMPSDCLVFSRGQFGL